MFRIGHGFDVHRFGEGDHILLAGVKIPYEQGFVAHSDGDVALHALCDALLGAAALGDIGGHFPDTDAQYQGIESRKLLRSVVEKVTQQGFRVSNVDLTLVAQSPRLSGFIDTMCENIANDLVIPRSATNVKATTTEKLGYIGRQEGIAAHAVVLLHTP